MERERDRQTDKTLCSLAVERKSFQMVPLVFLVLMETETDRREEPRLVTASQDTTKV